MTRRKVIGVLLLAGTLHALPVGAAGSLPQPADERQVCPRVIAEGATEIVKAALRLEARLPRVREADARKFAPYAPDGLSPTVLIARRPQYHIWLMKRQLAEVADRVGRLPTHRNPAIRVLRIIDSASDAQAQLALASTALAYASAFRGHESELGADAVAVPSAEQVHIYARELEALSISLSLLITCQLRQLR